MQGPRNASGLERFEASRYNAVMLATFILQLMVGIGLMWAVMPRAAVTTGFFRNQLLLTLGLAIVAGLAASAPTEPASPQFPPWATVACCGVAAFAAFIGQAVWMLGWRKAGDVCLFVVLVGSVAALGFVDLLRFDPRSPVGALHWASRGATAAIVGSTVTGMLLGHWYLTAPTMSIAPLGTLTQAVFWSAVVRFAVSAAALMLGGLERIHNPAHWTWLAMRWGGGILVPVVLAMMTWRILKLRNTQAATGVLFAAVITTFIGELAGSLLTLDLKHPY